MLKDQLHGVYPRAAGLDLHKKQITASVRLCHPEQIEPCDETRVFSALPSGLKQMAEWLKSHQIQAVAMEATGIY